MKEQDVYEIIQCLPKSRTLFPYFRDRYALMLLSNFVGGGKSKKEILESSFGKLLDKSVARQAMSHANGQHLTRDVFDGHWGSEFEQYRLTLGTWSKSRGAYDSWDQTSRKGMNLVLQLNFSSKHNRRYRSLIRPRGYHPFQWDFHPIARKGFLTMAWARLDIELLSGEALIEEIQNDWLREALEVYEWYRDRAERPDFCELDHQKRSEILRMRNVLHTYVKEILLPHFKIWGEAMLAATVWFLREELGLKRIFYHDYNSMARVKRADVTPPRSVYTSLPRKFCFRNTKESPMFLAGTSRGKRVPRRMKNAAFQLLELN